MICSLFIKYILSPALLFSVISPKDIDLIPLKTNDCLIDDFKRFICSPSEKVLSTYNIKLNQKTSTIEVKNRITQESIKLGLLIDVNKSSRIDLEKIFWIVDFSKDEEGGGVLTGLIYREVFKGPEGDENEIYTVLDFNPKRACVVSKFSSLRLGPEPDLLSNAKRVALNLKNSQCL